MHKPPLTQLPPVLRHTLKSDRGSPYNNETNCVWGPQPGRSYLLFEQALLIFQACLQSPEDLLVIFQGDPPTPACAERTRELTPVSGLRAPRWLWVQAPQHTSHGCHLLQQERSQLAPGTSICFRDESDCNPYVRETGQTPERVGPGDGFC